MYQGKVRSGVEVESQVNKYLCLLRRTFRLLREVQMFSYMARIVLMPGRPPELNVDVMEESIRNINIKD